MKYPILLPNIFNHPFTYESDYKLKLGEYVIVPFGKSKIIGVVWNEFEKNNKKKFRIKKILKKLEIAALNHNIIKFLNWFSQYNLIPKGMSLKLTLLNNNAIQKIEDEKYKDYAYNSIVNKFKLSSEQQKSLEQINRSSDKFRVHVLQGTTGSGKTIVYFEALKNIIQKGYQGLILLPEIGLTNEFEKKFFEFLDLRQLFGIRQ